MTHSRRIFLLNVPAAVAAGAFFRFAIAAATSAPLAETDPLAKALGYTADASKANKAKFPKYAVGQNCSNCTLYKGNATEAMGSCSVFPNKLVASSGWCSTWTKKV